MAFPPGQRRARSKLGLDQAETAFAALVEDVDLARVGVLEDVEVVVERSACAHVFLFLNKTNVSSHQAPVFSLLVRSLEMCVCVCVCV